MGWAHGLNYRGEEIGYGVEAICEHVGCNSFDPIDKGLAYCCGGLAGVEGTFGCGHYFCLGHLIFTCKPSPKVASAHQLCESCDAAAPWEVPEDADFYPEWFDACTLEFCACQDERG